MPHAKQLPSKERALAISAGSVSARAVATVIDAGVAAGVRRDILMKAADVTDDDLRDPDARLPVASRIALWHTAARS